MERLLLTSYFKKVTNLVPDFLETDPTGKKVCFITTASVPEKVNFFVSSGKKALEKHGMVIMELEISTASTEEIEDKIFKSDIIYVAGGNTFFLLDALRKTGVDKLIIEQIRNGKPYIGESAGSMILSGNIEYASIMDSPKVAPGLNGEYHALAITEFSIVPHANNAPFKNVVKRIVQTYSDNYNLSLISNNQAIMKIGEQIKLFNVE
ncbi:MAG: Type 1 glutamine amidotransferase-like domain-containing protein, partial [Bacilli bacterium]